MLDEIQSHALKLVSGMENQSNNSVDLILELLSCVASFSSPLQKSMFEKIFQQYMANNLTISTIPSFYKIIYHVKTSDKRVYDRFWNKSLELTMGIENQAEKKLQDILVLCSKYMQFCRDVSFGYRYHNLEKTVSDFLIKELHYNILTQVPALFSRVAAFVLAFSNDNYVDDVIEQASVLMKKFKAIDCLNLAKGLQFAMQNRKSGNTRLQKLNTSLYEHTMEEFNNTDSVIDRNILLRTCLYRKDVFVNELFQKMLKCCLENPIEMNTHTIKNICFYMQINNYLDTEIVDLITEYIVESDYSVLGSTVERVLHLCYSLGHTPKRAEAFFAVAAKLIIRYSSSLLHPVIKIINTLSV